MDAINSYLKFEAMKKGLCKQWTEEWTSDCDAAELADKYKRGLDFCIKNDYPSKEFLTSTFGEDVLKENGIYVGVEGFEDVPGSGIFVVQHSSKGKLVFKDYDVATIWVRHDSEVDIQVKNYAIAIIHVLDTAKVNIVGTSSNTATVRTHGNDTNVSYMGNVTIKKSSQEYK